MQIRPVTFWSASCTVRQGQALPFCRRHLFLSSFTLPHRPSPECVFLKKTKQTNKNLIYLMEESGDGSASPSSEVGRGDQTALWQVSVFFQSFCSLSAPYLRLHDKVCLWMSRRLPCSTPTYLFFPPLSYFYYLCVHVRLHVCGHTPATACV